ncbi:MAG: hypothetical protein VYE64_09055, partial [Planctomycetota bacterium]|nr:hypothetical protein [Planctomycetota bacterium]
MNFQSYHPQRRRRPLVVCLFIALLAIDTGAGNGQQPTAPSSELTFENAIRPFLKAHCYECHTGEIA